MSLDPREAAARALTARNRELNRRHQERRTSGSSPAAEIQRRQEAVDRQNEQTRRDTAAAIERQTRASVSANRFETNPERAVADAIRRSQTGRGGTALSPIPESGRRQADLQAALRAREREAARREAERRENEQRQFLIRQEQDRPSSVQASTRTPTPQAATSGRYRGAQEYDGGIVIGTDQSNNYVITNVAGSGNTIIYRIYGPDGRRIASRVEGNPNFDWYSYFFETIRPFSDSSPAPQFDDGSPIPGFEVDEDFEETGFRVPGGGAPDFEEEVARGVEETSVPDAVMRAGENVVNAVVQPIAEALSPGTDAEVAPVVSPTETSDEPPGETEEEPVEEGSPGAVGTGGDDSEGDTTPAPQGVPFRRTTELNCLQNAIRVGSSIFGSEADTSCSFDLDSKANVYTKVELVFEGRQPYNGMATVIMMVNGVEAGTISWNAFESNRRKKQSFNVTDLVYDGNNKVELTYRTVGVTTEDSTLTYTLHMRIEGRTRVGDSTGNLPMREPRPMRAADRVDRLALLAIGVGAAFGTAYLLNHRRDRR